MTAGPMSNVPGKPQPGEQFFQQSMADLSRRLADRAGRQPTPDLQAQAEARRRAMQAYERERARKLRLVLTGAAAVFATAGIAWGVVMLGETETPAAAGPIASTPLAPPAAIASAEPAFPPPRQVEAAVVPAPAATDVVQPPAEPVQAVPEPSTPARAAQSASADPAPQGAAAPLAPPQAEPLPAAPPGPPPLNRPEIREVQKRLRGFGFDPGPVDGVAGRQTEIATQRYLEARGQPQLPPTDRQLLDQLRQDPTVQAAPPPAAQPTQMAQRPAQQDRRGTQVSAAQPARGSFDPFQPVKYAGTEITRWLSMVFR